MKTMMAGWALALFMGAGMAQAADFKVGVVDVERVLRESAPALKAEKKIEKEFSGRDQEIRKMVKQAKDMQATLERDAMTMSEANYRSKERELNALNANVQRMQREYREDLNLRKNEELAIVLEQANKAIQAIAEVEKYDLVLQEAIYYNAKINITDKVIKYLADKSEVKPEAKAVETGAAPADKPEAK